MRPQAGVDRLKPVPPMHPNDLPVVGQALSRVPQFPGAGVALDRFAGPVAQLGQTGRDHRERLHLSHRQPGPGSGNERRRRSQGAGARHAVVRKSVIAMNQTCCRSALAALLQAACAFTQPGVFTREQLIKYTPEWKGERFADGSPKVPDSVLKRMQTVTLEEAWAVIKQAAYGHQYDDNWGTIIHPEKVLVGRALTAQWLPGRPDIHRVIAEQGKSDGRIGGQNVWPVDMLQPGDVYVCDHFGLKEDGPSIGDNVGNAIYARSGNGIVYDGAVRDINGLKELENFTSFVRSYDPSHHLSNLTAGDRMNSTMIGINIPIRIG